MTSQARKGRLRVLTYAWHVGHQFELFKLPYDFTLFQNAHSIEWNEEVRPLPDSVTYTRSLRREDHDLAILPFDEHILTPTVGQSHLKPDWGDNFIRLLQWCRENDLPIIGLCHGTVPRVGRFRPEMTGPERSAVDEPTLKRLRELVDDEFVVCNSRQALEEWGFSGRAITHGFDPDEYPLGDRVRGVLTIGGNMYRNGIYQGFDVLEACARELSVDLIGRDALLDAHESNALLHRIEVPRPRALPGTRLLRARRRRYGLKKFEHYKATIGEHAIYLNTTRYSPMPRARAEAMLCGLAVVSTPYHDFASYVEPGRTGYLFEKAEDAIEIIRELERSPDLAREVGNRGRDAARESFHIQRYLADWKSTVESRLG